MLKKKELSQTDIRYIRDPFCERPFEMKIEMARRNKRTQRYRSTAKSRICGMTVGDIRYCFQQLRNAGNLLTPEFVLYNGQCAGEFALSYLIETSNSMRRKRRDQEGDGYTFIYEPFAALEDLPDTQLVINNESTKQNVVQFA